MRSNELKSGVILSYINLGLGMIIPFIYTPIMLRILGQAEYGLFSLANSTVAYLSLLSFGFGSAIIRYISKYRAECDKKSEQTMFGFFLLLYSVLALLVIIVGLIITVSIEEIFNNGLDSHEILRLKILVFIMTLNTALSFPNTVFSSIIVAYERFVFRKLLDMVATILAPLANLIALLMGYSSIGMAIAATIVQLLIFPINVLYCTKQLKIKPILSNLPKNLIKEIIAFSFFIFLGSIVDILFWSTDKVILGMLSGSIAVAIYNVGGTFNNMIINLSTAISGVLAPRITGMIIKDASKEALTELFIKIGRLQFIIIALIISGFTVFGKAFITLWAGMDYIDAYWITILTMFPLAVPLIQNTGLNIVIAQNKHQFRTVVYLIIAILNVISTYLCVPYYGIIGAAVCSCLAYILGQCFIMNIYYYKITQLNIPLFWKNIVAMSVIPIALTTIAIKIVNAIILDTWTKFFIFVMIFSILYSILMYKFSFNQYEKNLFKTLIMNITRKFMHR